MMPNSKPPTGNSEGAHLHGESEGPKYGERLDGEELTAWKIAQEVEDETFAGMSVDEFDDKVMAMLKQEFGDNITVTPLGARMIERREEAPKLSELPVGSRIIAVSTLVLIAGCTLAAVGLVGLLLVKGIAALLGSL